jgi:hypothetical protein
MTMTSKISAADEAHAQYAQPMLQHSRYLGPAAGRKSLVFADIYIWDPAPDAVPVETVTHEMVPRPAQVGISFVHYWNVPTVHGRATVDIADRWFEESGPDLPRLAAWVDPHVRAVLDAAQDSGNTTHAGCIHMTPDVLTPADDVLDLWIFDNPGADRYGRHSALQSWRLANVVCPETGYRWGRKWLVTVPDPERLAALRHALEVLPEVAP